LTTIADTHRRACQTRDAVGELASDELLFLGTDRCRDGDGLGVLVSSDGLSRIPDERWLLCWDAVGPYRLFELCDGDRPGRFSARIVAVAEDH
jgi:hypothetical protein